MLVILFLLQVSTLNRAKGKACCKHSFVISIFYFEIHVLNFSQDGFGEDLIAGRQNIFSRYFMQ